MLCANRAGYLFLGRRSVPVLFAVAARRGALRSSDTRFLFDEQSYPSGDSSGGRLIQDYAKPLLPTRPMDQ